MFLTVWVVGFIIIQLVFFPLIAFSFIHTHKAPT